MRLLLILISGFTASCAGVVLNPYGLPYSEDNQMPSKFLRGCSAPGGITQAPFLVSGSKPFFPDGERRKGTEGTAVVEYTVTSEGKVQVNAYESKESQWFANHAAIAMRDWVVKPASNKGLAVTAKCSIEIIYKYPS